MYIRVHIYIQTYVCIHIYIYKRTPKVVSRLLLGRSTLRGVETYLLLTRKTALSHVKRALSFMERALCLVRRDVELCLLRTHKRALSDVKRALRSMKRALSTMKKGPVFCLKRCRAVSPAHTQKSFIFCFI